MLKEGWFISQKSDTGSSQVFKPSKLQKNSNPGCTITRKGQILRLGFPAPRGGKWVYVYWEKVVFAMFDTCFSCKLRQRIFQWCPATGQGAQTEAQEVPSEHGEELLHSEGDGALEEAAQRLWILLLWRYSEPAWIRSCATCSR